MEKIKNFLILGAAFFLLTIMPWWLMTAGAALYKYVDKKGTVHFTDRYESIPKEYRDQVKTIREEPKPQPPAPPAEEKEKKREGEPAAEERVIKVREADRKELEVVRDKMEAEAKKLKAFEEKEKQIEELRKQIEDKQKQARSLRTNWMVHDRNTIIRLNEDIEALKKQIKSIQNELEGEK
ncbi:MAG: DUF4124 domain-containing protein [Thermodesulfobacteriota bacterium]|nr:DUF4124 domain-containing protein [Thermodesulfobacteriota bacterium]